MTKKVKPNTKLKASKSQLDKFKKACKESDIKEREVATVVKKVAKIKKK